MRNATFVCLILATFLLISVARDMRVVWDQTWRAQTWRAQQLAAAAEEEEKKKKQLPARGKSLTITLTILMRNCVLSSTIIVRATF